MSKGDLALIKQQKRNEFEDRLRDYVLRLDYLEKKSAVSKQDYQKIFNQLQESKLALEQVLNDYFDERILQITIEGILKNLEHSLNKDINSVLNRQPPELVSTYYFDLVEHRLQKVIDNLKNEGNISNEAEHQVREFMQDKRLYILEHQLAKPRISREELERLAQEYESDASSFIQKHRE